jgi:hypothetical protein
VRGSEQARGKRRACRKREAEGKRRVRSAANGRTGNASRRAGLQCGERARRKSGRAGNCECAVEMQVGVSVRETASGHAGMRAGVRETSSAWKSSSHANSKRVCDISPSGHAGNITSAACKWKCDGVVRRRNTKKGVWTQEQRILCERSIVRSRMEVGICQ